MQIRLIAAVAALFFMGAAHAAPAPRVPVDASFEDLVLENIGERFGFDWRLVEPAPDAQRLARGSWDMSSRISSAPAFTVLQVDRRKDWGDMFERRRPVDARKDWGFPVRPGVFEPTYGWHEHRFGWLHRPPIPAVYEPSALALMLTGAALLGFALRRRNQPTTRR